MVGTIIGSGIFLVPREMMQDVGSSALVYLAWIVGGLLSLFGAMTYAELGAMLPYAGGEYVYLRGAYGDTTAFLYMWTWFAVAKPASIAAVTIGLARTLGFFPSFHWLGYIHPGPYSAPLVAGLRHRRHLVHHRPQLPRHQKSSRFSACLHHAQSHPDPDRRRLLLRFRTGSLLQLHHLASSRRRRPHGLHGCANRHALGLRRMERPHHGRRRSSPSGALIAHRPHRWTVYRGISLHGHQRGHPVHASRCAIAASERPAVTALTVVAGPAGAGFVAAAMALSIFVTLNGTIMSGARIPYAASRDRLFFRQFAHIHPRYQSPSTSLIIQALLSTVLLVFLSRFQQFFELAVFAEWLFYMLTATTVFVYRRKIPMPRAPTRSGAIPFCPRSLSFAPPRCSSRAISAISRVRCSERPSSFSACPSSGS